MIINFIVIVSLNHCCLFFLNCWCGVVTASCVRRNHLWLMLPTTSYVCQTWYEWNWDDKNSFFALIFLDIILIGIVCGNWFVCNCIFKILNCAIFSNTENINVIIFAVENSFCLWFHNLHCSSSFSLHIYEKIIANLRVDFSVWNTFLYVMLFLVLYYIIRKSVQGAVTQGTMSTRTNR